MSKEFGEIAQVSPTPNNLNTTHYSQDSSVLVATLISYWDQITTHPQIQNPTLQASLQTLSEPKAAVSHAPNKVEKIEQVGEWWWLTGTGFNVKKQTAKLIRDLAAGQGVSAFPKIKQDIIGFKNEYLAEELAWPVPYEIVEVNGRQRLVGGLYGHEPLVDMVDKNERDGAVFEACSRIEEEVLASPPGSLIVMANPPGFTGMRDGEGAPIVYTVTQTCIIKALGRGQLEAFTVVTDMDVEENKMLLLKLGVPREDLLRPNLTHRETVANIVKNIAFLAPASRLNRIEDVVGAIQEVKKAPWAFMTELGEKRGFDGIYQNITRGRQMLSLDDTCERYMQAFEAEAILQAEALIAELRAMGIDGSKPISVEYSEYLAGRLESARAIAKILGQTVLKIARAVRVGEVEGEMSESDYQEEHVQVQAKKGCGGGGTKKHPWGDQECKSIKCTCGWVPNDDEVDTIMALRFFGVPSICKVCGEVY